MATARTKDGALPRDLRPMLATTAALPTDDAAWAYEVKWDGVRALVAVEGGRVTVTTRNGNDVSGAYPELQGLAADLGSRQVLLDGEVVAFAPDGRSDFGLLQSRMHVRRPTASLLAATPVTLLAFDLLHSNGQSLLGETYDVRCAALADLGLSGPHWQVPPVFLGDGPAVVAATQAQGLEGVVAKRRDSRYEPGRRSELWRKIKHVHRTSAVIVGWKPGEGGREGQIGSLLLAVPGAGGLDFAGHVGTGFSAATLGALQGQLAPLRRDSPALAGVPALHARAAVWVEPVLVCDVDYTEWTRDGRLRHPSYKGLRPDLDPAQVVRE